MDSYELCREHREGPNIMNDRDHRCDIMLLKALIEDDVYKALQRHFQKQDRAAVMKAFDAKMEAYKRDLLKREDSTMHFLFCHTHFLLGFATATEDGVRNIEEDYVEPGEKLGGDSKSSFSRFSAASECASVRLIPLASEVLGPCGAEKSGCREEWLAFCSSKGIQSLFTSYRS
ncbi:eukaryotic translation initiation factor 3 subunit a-like protein [Plakobranchus ocellatus]|uniref:Eukaryotic translation initiation factor 3 subunit a-like protein n=1 Tax=Plakobranchus ocellatus TaxID=259542 RepID=A0AAV4CWF1_9GAST|nr:eukaryotic translation initiation factor 3 subunit a-like protein [Plakobranchus ocellatus]